MNLSVSQNEQYWVGVHLSLTSCNYVDLLLYNRTEIGGAEEWDSWKSVSVELKQILDPFYFRESRDTVKWETMVGLSRSHESGHTSETINWELFIIIVDFYNWPNLLNRFFILVLVKKGMKWGWFTQFSIWSCVINSNTEANLHATF